MNIAYTDLPDLKLAPQQVRTETMPKASSRPTSFRASGALDRIPTPIILRQPPIVVVRDVAS